jgi:glutamate carboxypeptidase
MLGKVSLWQTCNRKGLSMAEIPHRSNELAQSQTAIHQTLNSGQGWLVRLANNRDRLLDRVAELVHQESPTSQPEGVSAAQSIVAGWAEELGGRVLRHPRTGSAGVLEARFGDPDDPRRPVLVLGHLDTVWPLGTLARMPWDVQDGWAYGPGVLDMKAGVVMALEALRLVRETDQARPVVLLLSGDEETGSLHSRELIEAIARGCRAVFVLEPAQGRQGAYKTARKGVGQFRLDVSGVPSHSGVDFSAGHSAVRELAWQIEQISALSDMERGTTVNVGVIGGGTQPNVVAAEAWAEIDVRVTTLEDAAEIERRLRELQSRDTACRLTVSGGLNRPPMERTAGTAALFELAQMVAAEFGIPLEEASTGGGSDGNFTSALGVPTLDGMGAVGKGAHAENESIEVDSLVYRTALLAGVIARTI